MKIAIIGTGAYSLAIAQNLECEEIRLWTESKTVESTFKKTKKLDDIIKGVKLPKNTIISTKYDVVLNDADLVFLLTSSGYVEQVAIDIKPYLNKKSIVVCGTKGILPNGILISSILKKNLPTKRLLYISGPTYSGDLIKNHPVGLVLAGLDTEAKRIVKKVFKKNIMIKNSLDIDGVEVCGAIKNVFAIGAGILDGMKYGNSTKYFYITILAKETRKILRKLDGFPETMYGLAGLGDLMLTCSMNESRNYQLGKLIGSKKMKDLKKHLKENTCEGYYTLDSLNDLFNKKKIEFPVVKALHDILYHNANPDVLIDALLK